jgi:hypothetical protein
MCHIPADFPSGSNFTAGNRLFGPWISTSLHWNPLVTGSWLGNQSTFGMHSSKYISGIRGNLGTTMGRKTYGDGGFVRRPGQKYFGSNFNISDFSCVSLKKLMKVNYNLVYFNEKFIHIISDPEILILWYKIIKSNSGNFTPAIDWQTLDNIKLD